MNKFIKQQLMKCRIGIPDWNDDTREILIPLCSNTTPVQPARNKNQNIIIKDYIIHEPGNFTLSANYNKGTKPPEHNMNVKILEIRGKMYLVEGIGINTHVYWKGWLPEKGFDIK